LCNSTYKEPRIDYGHVRIRGRDCECEAGSNCENETDQFEVERSPITFKTTKPE